MFHVLEHLPSPLGTFKKIHSCLNPGGIAIVEVPWYEAQNTSLNNIFFKAHIFYFTAETLSACASAYFDVIKVITKGMLMVCLRAKEVPTQPTLPQPTSLRRIKQSTEQRSWLTYLFKSGGMLSLFRRIRRRIREQRRRGMAPKAILDDLYETSGILS